MALPSLPLALSQIKSEFGGNDTLGNYHRGQLYVPNHTANAGIPSSGTISIGNFPGSERNFTCSMTVGYNGSDQWGYTSIVGSVSRSGIGTGGNTLNQTNFEAFYDYYVYDPFFSGYVYYGTFFNVSGNNTGSWWGTISWGSLSFSRAGSSSPSGSYVGGITQWAWGGGPYFASIGATDTFTCTV